MGLPLQIFLPASRQCHLGGPFSGHLSCGANGLLRHRQPSQGCEDLGYSPRPWSQSARKSSDRGEEVHLFLRSPLLLL